MYKKQRNGGFRVSNHLDEPKSGQTLSFFPSAVFQLPSHPQCSNNSGPFQCLKRSNLIISRRVSYEHAPAPPRLRPPSPKAKPPPRWKRRPRRSPPFIRRIPRQGGCPARGPPRCAALCPLPPAALRAVRLPSLPRSPAPFAAKVHKFTSHTPPAPLDSTHSPPPPRFHAKLPLCSCCLLEQSGATEDTLPSMGLLAGTCRSLSCPWPRSLTVSSLGLGLFLRPGGTYFFVPVFTEKFSFRSPPSPGLPPGLTPPRLHLCQSGDERTCHPLASARRRLARPLPSSPATAGPARQTAMGPASRGDEGRGGRRRGLTRPRVTSTAGRAGQAPR